MTYHTFLRQLIPPALAFAALALAANMVSCAVSNHGRPLASADVLVQVGDGHGSGIYIGKHLFLTASHVVDSAPNGKATVVTSAGESIEVEVLWTNKSYDVALMSSSTELDATSASLSCRRPDPKTHANIEIVGNPLSFRGVHTQGFVAREVREWDQLPRFHFIADATVAPGSSGGGVYDANGNLIGIVSAMANARTDFMSTHLIPLAFIVPTSAICKLMGR